MRKEVMAMGLAGALLFGATTAEAAVSPAQIRTAVEAKYDGFVADVGYLVAIDSGTGNVEGSRKIAAYLQENLEALGAKVEFRDNENGRHVIARIKGEGKLRVLLSPHTDTVFDPGEAAKRPFSVDSDKIGHGPGSGDCKASVSQMVQMAKVLKELEIKNFGELIIYFDAEEETGSDMEEAILEELAKQADVALIVDGARPGWGIVTQRKGSANYTIKVEGIQGHAGNAPQASASAIAELSNQLAAICKLSSPLPGNPKDYSLDALKAKNVQDHGQFIPENWINIGEISSTNTKVNRVADNASAKLQVRCYKMSELERLDKEIRAIAAKTTVPGTKVTLSGGISGVPMEKTAKAAAVIEAYKKIVKQEFKADVVEWVAGGMTVGNSTAKFIPTVDALGIEADPMLEHTEKEMVNLGSFTPRTTALIELISELSQRELAK